MYCFETWHTAKLHSILKWRLLWSAFIQSYGSWRYLEMHSLQTKGKVCSIFTSKEKKKLMYVCKWILATKLSISTYLFFHTSSCGIWSWHLFWRSPISMPFLFMSRNAMRTLRWRHCMLLFFVNNMVLHCQEKQMESKKVLD